MVFSLGKAETVAYISAYTCDVVWGGKETQKKLYQQNKAQGNSCQGKKKKKNNAHTPWLTTYRTEVQSKSTKRAR